MKIVQVIVVPNAKRDEVIPAIHGFRVRVKAPALDGKANRAVLDLIASHFGLKKSQVRIVQGALSRKKTIELEANSFIPEKR